MLILICCSIIIHYRSNSNAHLVTMGSGCKGFTSFMRFENHDPVQQSIPDVMHTIKDAIVNLYDLITGKDDTINVEAAR